jgi:hypothetical protein
MSNISKVSGKIQARWQDAANGLLGLWLAVSPWVLAYVEETTPAWNAAVIGIAAATALMEFQKWEEWVTAALAVWLIASPWILGFSGIEAATWNHVGVGALVAVLALWSAMAVPDTRGLATKS